MAMVLSFFNLYSEEGKMNTLRISQQNWVWGRDMDKVCECRDQVANKFKHLKTKM